MINKSEIQIVCEIENVGQEFNPERTGTYLCSCFTRIIE
jgi:hypothetical protein